MNIESSPKIHFFNLDVLRCVCAFMVVFAHSYEGFCGWLRDPLDAYPIISSKVKMFAGNLSIGVDVFFVISGFLITFLLLNEKKTIGNINIIKFITRRSLRIWPLYFFSILFGFIIVSLTNKMPHPNYVANLLFLNNFNAIATGNWEAPFAHFWSICVEEHFYILWPLVLFFTPLKNIPFVTIFFIIISIFTRYYFTLGATGPIQMQLHVHTLARIDEILVGALVAYIHFVKPINVNIDKKARLLVYFVFIFLLFIDEHNNWIGGTFDIVFKKYIYLSFIVFWLVNYLFNADAFWNFKNKNVIHYLGKISFGIYVYHNMLITPFLNKVIIRFSINSFIIYEIGYLLLVTGISILSFELYEKYFLRLKQKFEIIKTMR